MDAKKSKKANMQSYRSLFFEIGMLVSLGIVFAAFQWSSKDQLVAFDLVSDINLTFEDEWMPLPTKPKEVLPEPKQQVVEVIDIVENDVEIEDVEIEDVEGDLDIAVQIIAFEPDEDEEIEPETFYIVENPPVYPGGDKGLLSDIMSRVVYPEIAKENGIQGRVFVEFIVNYRGQVDKVHVTRGVDPALDKEAVRVIESLTGWIPGKQRGKAVNVSFTVPINFQLN